MERTKLILHLDLLKREFYSSDFSIQVTQEFSLVLNYY